MSSASRSKPVWRAVPARVGDPVAVTLLVALRSTPTPSHVRRVPGRTSGRGRVSTVPPWGSPTTSGGARAPRPPRPRGPRPDPTGGRWEQAGHAPPSGDGNGFGTRFAEDFQLLAEHGLTHHRLSIEWARIEPYEGRHDRDEIDRYRDVLRCGARRRRRHRGSACTTSRCPGGSRRHARLPRRAGPQLLLGPPRRLHGRDVRRPGLRLEADQRARTPTRSSAGSSVRRRPGKRDRAPSSKRSRRRTWPTTRPGGCCAAAIGRSRPSTTSAPTSPTPTSSRRPASGPSTTALWGCWIRAQNDGVLAVGDRPPIENEEFVDAFDLIGFSYYNATKILAEGVASVSRRGSRRSARLRPLERRSRAHAAASGRRAPRPATCSSPSTAWAPTTTTGARRS